MAIGLIALLDDIALLADDTTVVVKNVGASTASILGDDVAVNASSATGFPAKRELVVIYEIAKGAVLNKFIILPFAFLLSYYFPFLITIMLVAGGIFLLYEGGEKIEEYLYIKLQIPEKQARHETELSFSTPKTVAEIEKKKIKSAIITDFILSIEIIVISMSSVTDTSLLVKVLAVTIISLLAVVFVYGSVAIIVRMDDFGIYLRNKGQVKIGNFFIMLMPKVIKSLTFIGTAAMILVGGGILVHNISIIHELSHFTEIGILNNTIAGLVVSIIILVGVTTFEKIREVVGK